MRRSHLLAALSLATLSPLAHAFTITPTFVDGDTQSWTTTEEQVVNQAINDWTSQLSLSNTTLNNSINIPITFDFTHAGNSYLGEWTGSVVGAPANTSLYPWSPYINDVININADLMVPRDPSTGDGYNVTLLFSQDPVTTDNWDALSVIQHELGHALGFTTLYADSYGKSPDHNKYEDHVTFDSDSATFDETDGGLNIPLDSIANFVHTGTASDLMSTSLFNGDRKNISIADLQALSLAYGYTLTINPGISYTTPTLNLAGLNVNGSLFITSTTGIRQSADVLLNSTSLTVGSTGLLDISNHDLIIHAGLALTDVKNLINAGKGAGNWNGTHGITSSAAAGTTNMGLGYATAASVNLTSFDDASVAPTDILVKYTFLGDANLDGMVDISDLTTVANNWQSTTATWAQGDFDGNGTVDILDLTYVANNWQAGTTNNSAMLMPSFATLLVPEPSTLLLATLALPALLLKRRPQKV